MLEDQILENSEDCLETAEEYLVYDTPEAIPDEKSE